MNREDQDYMERHYHLSWGRDWVRSPRYGIPVLLPETGRPRCVVPFDKMNVDIPAEAYLSINRDGEMMHLRIYRDHFPVMDIDVGHSHHYGKDGDFVHVHDFRKDAGGDPDRGVGRSITESELRKYGKLIEKMKGSMK